MKLCEFEQEEITFTQVVIDGVAYQTLGNFKSQKEAKEYLLKNLDLKEHTEHIKIMKAKKHKVKI